MPPATQQLTISVQVKDQLTRAMKSMGGAVESFRKRGVAAFKGVANAVGSFLTSGIARLAGVLGAGILFRAAFNDARDFAAAMSEVSTIAGDAAGSLEDLSRQTLDLATSLGLDEVQTARGLYQVLSAGISDTSEALQVLDQSSRLAIAGVSDVRATTDLVTSAINAYGLSARDASRVSDVLFKTVQVGKTTIGELAGSFGQVAPIAAQLGVGLEDLSGALASITLTGASTSQAVTQVRAVLNALLRNGEKVDELFQERLGKSFSETDIRTRGLVAVLDDLREATGGSTTELQKMLSEVEAVTGTLNLTGDASERTSRVLRDVADSAGAAGTAFEKRLLDPFNVLSATFGAINKGLASLASSFVTAFSGETLRNAEEFSRQMLAIKRSIEELAPVAELLGGLFSEIAGGLKDFALGATAFVRFELGIGDALRGIEGSAERAAARQEFLRDVMIDVYGRRYGLTAEKSAGDLEEGLDAAAGAAAGVKAELEGLGGGAASGGQFEPLIAANEAFIRVRSELLSQSDELSVKLIALEDRYEGQRQSVILAAQNELDRLRILRETNPELEQSVRANEDLTRELRDQRIAQIDAAQAEDRRTRKIQAQKDEVESLTRAWGRIGSVIGGYAEQAVAAIASVTVELGNQGAAIFAASQTIGDGFQAGFQDAINLLKDDFATGFRAAESAVFSTTDAFSGFFESIASGSKSGSDALKQLVQDVARAMNRIVSEILAAKAVTGLVDLFGGSAEQKLATDLASNLVTNFSFAGFAKGGVIPGGLGGAVPLKGYASGGPIFDRPHVALIGEGPTNEAAVPLPDGRSIPVRLEGGRARGEMVNNVSVSPNVNITLQAIDSQSGSQVLIRESETIAQVVAAKIVEGSNLRSVIGSVPRSQTS